MNEKYEFREIMPEEAEEAADIEEICFPPEEACSRVMIRKRAKNVSELFLVVIDRENGRMAGFLNGLATDEERLKDEFFKDASLHRAEGKNVMLLGLDVRPEYRGTGLARALVNSYVEKERARGRKRLVLTCHAERINMYEKFGFVDLGMSDSVWGGKEWHEMEYCL